MCDNLAKLTETRCDILFDIAFNSSFERSDKRTAELMNSVAGKLAVYQREVNKNVASSSILVTINRLQNYYSMMYSFCLHTLLIFSNGVSEMEHQ